MKKMFDIKRFAAALLAALSLLPTAMRADSYTTMWNEVTIAEKKDLPKTQIQKLKLIIDKAERERAYGHLLKAEYKTLAVWGSISADSLLPKAEVLERKAAAMEATDPAAAAVCYAALGKAYTDSYVFGKEKQDKAKEFFKKALDNPQLLASKTALDYKPFIVEGRDSRIFNNDLLSLIGYTAEDYKTMHDYYAGTTNRAATLLTALAMVRQRHESDGTIRCNELKKSVYAVALDSLINLYSDLKECGEVAIERYNHIKQCKDVTLENRVNYINKALALWGELPHTNVLRNEYKQLTTPTFTAEMQQNIVLPDKDGVLQLTARNIGKLTVSISRLAVNGDTKLSPMNAKEYKLLKNAVVKGSERVFTRSFIGLRDYQTANDSILTGGLPVGVYLLEVSADNKNISPSRSLFYVTDMFAVYQQLPMGKLRLAALSATTGQPVPGATITIFTGNYKKQTIKCDDKGEAIFNLDKEHLQLLRVSTPKDNAMPLSGAWSNYSFYSNDFKNESVTLFTDRSIYRPGQTVHVAGIAKSTYKTETKVIGGRTVHLILRDANYKVIKEQDVTTDNFGKFSTDLQLPSSGLTGMFSIRTENALHGYTAFKVEEYKRPTFTVDFPEISEKYQDGDTLVVTAHARSYAGVPVQGAKVSYKVRRAQSLWWRFSSAYVNYQTDADAILFSGEAVTDADGAFKVEMPMQLPEWTDNADGITPYAFKLIPRFYTITAEADVTDLGGETRRGVLSLPLSNRATAFSIEMPEKSVRDSLKTMTFVLKNAAGNAIDGDVRYRIDGSAEEYHAKANVPVDIGSGVIAALKSGRHTLDAVCGTDTLQHKFVIFGTDDTVPCVKTPDWFYLSDHRFRTDGKPIRLQIGSSDADVHILYTACSGEDVIANGTTEVSNSLINRALTYKKEYGDALTLNVVWVKDGRVYSHNEVIEMPQEDKRLTVKWTTFRDRLTPGQKEEWSLSITKADGTPAEAQLLATLYDASLDQIRPHSWSFNATVFPHYASTRWGNPYFNNISLYCSMPQKFFDNNELCFNSMDIEAFARRIYIRGGYMMKDSKVMLKAESAMDEDKFFNSVEQGQVLKRNNIGSAAVPKSAVIRGTGDLNVAGSADADDANVPVADVAVRENLSETAFFYPTLSTDKDGNVNIGFTLPESITTWKFMGLAHDRDINHGLITAKAVAKKTVMVQPNMPRFIRLGDQATISAKIFNTSEKDVKGSAVMQLTDPDTEKVIFTQKKTFSVKAGETAAVSFDYSPKDCGSLLICKIFATGKDFSDGEQHYLPVLSDEELVTNTVPFTQNGAGIKAVDISKLFTDGSRKNRLTVEYTNNPAWLTVQALPYIGTPSGDNSISLAVAYYANSLAAHIVKQSPRIKTVFEKWKNEETKESLSSSLERNQELKNIVLDETPWAVTADNEAEMKLRLAGYFDTATLENNLDQMLSKLKKLQKEDGSWCWWQGMKHGSPSLTANIVELLTRLNSMTGRQAQTRTMLDKAFSFLGKTVVDKVKILKKAEKAGRHYVIDDYTSLQYLYICALDGRKLTAAEREASDYLLAHLKKNNASSTLYRKALMAVVLAKKGETKLAEEYLKSLDEYTVRTEELGRYYDSPRATYSWFDYRIPTQVAAIEAMTLVSPQNYAQSISEMKHWLLQQKRVQGWNTPINSVNAVYAFLNGNTSALENKEDATFSIDGKQLEMPAATAGLGYVKTTVDGKKQGVFTATKTSEGTSWGAVYGQSLQKTSSIEGSSAGFSVTREILSADNRPQTVFKTGDRIKVRITVKADRDYDFVQIKDKRAACMEPATQLSGYRGGYYCAPKDNATYYFFDRLSKGTHTIETEYYIDRTGRYETGTCSVECAYAPEYTARTASRTIEVK